MEEFYNNYYLKTREDGCIIDAFSDGPHYGRDTTGYTQFGRGGYQLRLFPPDGEENPALFEGHGIPLWHWDGEKITARSEEDIQTEIDNLPPPPPSQYEVLRADVDFLLVMQEV